MANKPLTQDQLAKVEEKLKTYMANKQSWVKRYGKDAENVMRGRAISTVKKETENMNKQKLKELVKTSLTKEVADSNLKDSVKKIINTSGYNEKDFQIISEPTNPNSIELRSGGDQYWAQLPEDLLSSLENEFNVVEDFLEDEDTLPLYYYMITPKMNEGKKEDITGPEGKPDGKIDSKDYLAKRDAAIKKAKGKIKEYNNNNDESLALTFKDSNEFKRAKEHFESGSSFSPFDINNEFKTFFFEVEDQADADSTEFYLTQELEGETDLSNYFFSMEPSSLSEDLDLGHQDNEPHMIKGELYRIGKYAMELYQMVDGFEGKGEVDFPAWWQSKITTSMNNMVSAKHYLDFELKEPAIDAMVGVASDEEVIDENIDKVDILSAELYKLKDKIQPAFFDKIRKFINMGSLEDAEYLLNRVKGQMKEKGLDEKKLTSAEKKKKEEIVKGMKDSFKGDKEAMYAIATDKAKKVAETIAKKLKENVGLKKGDTVEYEGNKYKIGSFDTEANLVYLNTIDGKPAEDRKGDYLKVNATRVKKTK